MVSQSCSRDKIRGIRAWVSGGSGALGMAFVRALLSHGAAGVVLADIRAPEEGTFRASDGVHFHYMDVRSVSAVIESLKRAEHQLGSLDLVVNNAGIVAEHDLEATVATNLKAVIEATEAAARVLGKGGMIVNIGSAAGIFPAREAPYYAASKAGVVMYTRSKARRLFSEKGVRLNVLCPAWVSAGMGKVTEMAPGWERLAEVVGVMEPAEVADALLRIICDKEMVGMAVYVSKKTGVCYPLRGLRPMREAKL